MIRIAIRAAVLPLLVVSAVVPARAAGRSILGHWVADAGGDTRCIFDWVEFTPRSRRSHTVPVGPFAGNVQTANVTYGTEPPNRVLVTGDAGLGTDIYIMPDNDHMYAENLTGCRYHRG